MADPLLITSLVVAGAALLCLWLGSSAPSAVQRLLQRRRRGFSLAQRLGRPSPPPQELEVTGTPTPQGVPATEERPDLLPRLSRLLSTTRLQPLVGRLAQTLTLTRIPLRPSEFLYLSLVSVFGTFLVFQLIALRLSTSTVVAILAGAVPFLYLQMAQQKRFQQLEAQVADALLLITNCLRSGTGFLDAMEAVAQEMDPPISEEFQRSLSDIAIGVSVDEAFIRLSSRCRSEDLDLAVTAFKIQREVGGSLAEILANIAETIRERQKLRQEVRTLSAQGKLSGIILCALPFVLMVGMQIVNPGYLSLLFTTSEGHAMLLVGLCLQIVGALIISRLVKIEV